MEHVQASFPPNPALAARSIVARKPVVYFYVADIDLDGFLCTFWYSFYCKSCNCVSKLQGGESSQIQKSRSSNTICPYTRIIDHGEGTPLFEGERATKTQEGKRWLNEG